jgi:hypothetical protein
MVKKGYLDVGANTQREGSISSRNNGSTTGRERGKAQSVFKVEPCV